MHLVVKTLDQHAYSGLQSMIDFIGSSAVPGALPLRTNQELWWCTSVEFPDQLRAVEAMLREEADHIIFKPDGAEPKAVERALFATDYHPNDAEQVAHTTRYLTDRLTVVHVSAQNDAIDQDIFLQQSESIQEQLNERVEFKLLHGSNPPFILLEAARNEAADMVVLSCSKRAFLRTAEGEGFLSELLKYSELPVLVHRNWESR